MSTEKSTSRLLLLHDNTAVGLFQQSGIAIVLSADGRFCCINNDGRSRIHFTHLCPFGYVNCVVQTILFRNRFVAKPFLCERFFQKKALRQTNSKHSVWTEVLGQGGSCRALVCPYRRRLAVPSIIRLHGDIVTETKAPRFHDPYVLSCVQLRFIPLSASGKSFELLLSSLLTEAETENTFNEPCSSGFQHSTCNQAGCSLADAQLMFSDLLPEMNLLMDTDEFLKTSTTFISIEIVNTVTYVHTNCDSYYDANDLEVEAWIPCFWFAGSHHCDGGAPSSSLGGHLNAEEWAEVGAAAHNELLQHGWASGDAVLALRGEVLTYYNDDLNLGKQFHLAAVTSFLGNSVNYMETASDDKDGTSAALVALWTLRDVISRLLRFREHIAARSYKFTQGNMQLSSIKGGLATAPLTITTRGGARLSAFPSLTSIGKMPHTLRYSKLRGAFPDRTLVELRLDEKVVDCLLPDGSHVVFPWESIDDLEDNFRNRLALAPGVAQRHHEHEPEHTGHACSSAIGIYIRTLLMFLRVASAPPQDRELMLRQMARTKTVAAAAQARIERHAAIASILTGNRRSSRVNQQGNHSGSKKSEVSMAEIVAKMKGRPDQNASRMLGVKASVCQNESQALKALRASQSTVERNKALLEAFSAESLPRRRMMSSSEQLDRFV